MAAALPKTDGPITISTNGNGVWTLNAVGTVFNSDANGVFSDTIKAQAKAEFAASFVEKKKLTDISTILESVDKIQKATVPAKARTGGIFDKGTPLSRAIKALETEINNIDRNPFYSRYSAAADINLFFETEQFGPDAPGTYRNDVQEGMAATAQVMDAAKQLVAPTYMLPAGGLAASLAAICGIEGAAGAERLLLQHPLEELQLQ
jgi:hypothetical protein